MKKKVIVDQNLLPWEASRAVEEERDSLHHSGGKEQSHGDSSADQAFYSISIFIVESDGIRVISIHLRVII